MKNWIIMEKTREEEEEEDEEEALELEAEAEVEEEITTRKTGEILRSRQRWLQRR